MRHRINCEEAAVVCIKSYLYRCVHGCLVCFLMVEKRRIESFVVCSCTTELILCGSVICNVSQSNVIYIIRTAATCSLYCISVVGF